MTTLWDELQGEHKQPFDKPEITAKTSHAQYCSYNMRHDSSLLASGISRELLTLRKRARKIMSLLTCIIQVESDTGTLEIDRTANLIQRNAPLLLTVSARNVNYQVDIAGSSLRDL